MFGSYRFPNDFTHFHMQIRCKTHPRCILNTSPACFEGSGTRKRETKTQNLKKLKTCPQKAERLVFNQTKVATEPTTTGATNPLMGTREAPHGLGIADVLHSVAQNIPEINLN